MIWAIVPAAGSGARLGGDRPKQYQRLAGTPMLEQTLAGLLAHPRIAGAMVALAADDVHWAGLRQEFSKPVRTCAGGTDRAASVLAALRALPAEVTDDSIVLVHDAARPCLHGDDIGRLLEAAADAAAGALLAAPVRDTLKRADADGHVLATVPRDALWRAFTPQAFRRRLLSDALARARADGVVVTDEAMAVERLGHRPLLVAGREDNIKVTVAADLAIAECILAAQHGQAIA